MKVDTNYKIIFSFLTITLILYIYTLLNHHVFGEWDGVMHYYSGLNILENFSYIGWASHFWPPLQPLLLSLGDPFLIGKFVALISGFFTLITIYLISNIYLKDKVSSLLVLGFIFSTSQFFEIFTLVENHALEVTFFISGIYFFIKSEKEKSKKYLFLAGVLIGLAGLSRYTSYALALSLGIYMISRLNYSSFKKLLIFSSAFIMISLLWWIPNFYLNGSPLATWQYINVGMSIFPDGKIDWIYNGQKDFNSLSELILAFPSEFIINFSKNVIKSMIIIATEITSNRFLSLVFLILFLYVTLKNKSFIDFIKENKLNILISLIYLSLCSTAFVFAEALYPVILIFSITVLVHILKFKFGKYVVLFFIVLNLFFTFKYVSHFLEREKTDGKQLTDLKQINSILIKDSIGRDVIISSINPARSYYSKLNWVMFPLGGAETICDVIEYNFHPKIIEYVPKIPSSLIIKGKHIDYLILTKGMEKYYPFINDDLTVDKGSCNKFDLEILYKSIDTVLYKVTNE